jgi:hypothetical protein
MGCPPASPASAQQLLDGLDLETNKGDAALQGGFDLDADKVARVIEPALAARPGREPLFADEYQNHIAGADGGRRCWRKSTPSGMASTSMKTDWEL